MIDTTETRAARSVPDDSSAPVDTPAIEVLWPPEPNRSSPRSRLSHLTIAQLVTVIGAALTIMAAISLLASSVMVVWLGRSAADHEHWANAEQHLDGMQESATQQYLQAMLAIRQGEGSEQAIQMQTAQISANIDQLIATTADLDPNSPFLDFGKALYQANLSLAAAGNDAIDAVDAGDAAAQTMAVASLDDAFADWRTANEEYRSAMRAAQSAGLAAQARHSDTAVAILAATAVIGIAVLAITRRLGRRARSREASLQATVEEEKELLRAIVDHTPESIAWKDSHLQLMGCNPAMMERFTEAGVDPSIGVKVSDSVSTDEIRRLVEDHEAMEAKVLATGEPLKGKQMDYSTPSGHPETVIRSIIPLMHKDSTIGVVSTMSDITEIVGLERSLAAAGRLESIGQLAAGIAHEINTPVQFVSDNTSFLNASFPDLISAFDRVAELASQTDKEAVDSVVKELDFEFLTEEIPDAIAQSHEGLNMIANIIRAMKDFAHPGGDVGPADINRLVTSTVEVSRNEWKYNADLELDLDEELPQPECDEGQIKQVVLNIVVNAAHAIADSDADRGQIKITTESTDEAVVLTISDTGTGMTPEVRARIFERFYTTKEVGRGSGQGLAIAYDAVKSHGGTIEVESAPGAGTTFTITIPLTQPTTD
ncbi:MAG: PAS domain-containing protein [bacterium]|nr:PAS domain-containing protein [bacterium]